MEELSLGGRDHREDLETAGNATCSSKGKKYHGFPSYLLASFLPCLSLAEPNQRWLAKKPGKCCFLWCTQNTGMVEDACRSKQIISTHCCFYYSAFVLVLSHSTLLVLLNIFFLSTLFASSFFVCDKKYNMIVFTIFKCSVPIGLVVLSIFTLLCNRFLQLFQLAKVKLYIHWTTHRFPSPWPLLLLFFLFLWIWLL